MGNGSTRSEKSLGGRDERRKKGTRPVGRGKKGKRRTGRKEPSCFSWFRGERRIAQAIESGSKKAARGEEKTKKDKSLLN